MKQPRCGPCAVDDVGPVRPDALVPADVLDPDQARLRAAEIAPAALAIDPVAAADDAVEKVVRREEGKIAAGVTKLRDQGVLVRSHVLLMAREDEQVVALREPRAARESLEIVVGDEVGLLVRVREPADDAEVA